MYATFLKLVTSHDYRSVRTHNWWIDKLICCFQGHQHVRRYPIERRRTMFSFGLLRKAGASAESNDEIERVPVLVDSTEQEKRWSINEQSHDLFLIKPNDLTILRRLESVEMDTCWSYDSHSWHRHMSINGEWFFVGQTDKQNRREDASTDQHCPRDDIVPIQVQTSCSKKYTKSCMTIDRRSVSCYSTRTTTRRFDIRLVTRFASDQTTEVHSRVMLERVRREWKRNLKNWSMDQYGDDF
jgi:hypothetical protein